MRRRETRQGAFTRVHPAYCRELMGFERIAWRTEWFAPRISAAFARKYITVKNQTKEEAAITATSSWVFDYVRLQYGVSFRHCLHLLHSFENVHEWHKETGRREDSTEVVVFFSWYEQWQMYVVIVAHSVALLLQFQYVTKVSFLAVPSPNWHHAHLEEASKDKDRSKWDLSNG